MNKELYKLFFDIQKKHWWFQVKKEIVTDLISRYFINRAAAKILDIGCGSGLMLSALQEVGQTYGMDSSDEAIDFSREIFTGEVRKGLLPENIPYKEEFFNLIVALDVIEHVDQDIESLKVMYSHLALNGKLIITVPAYMFLWSSFDELNQHKRRYTLIELKKKLVLAGFIIERISYFNTLLFPAVFLVRIFNSILRRDGSSEVEMPGRLMNSLLGRIFRLERFLLNYIDLPYGVSILVVAKK